MSKYQLLWEYIQKQNRDKLELDFSTIESILHHPINHSFLTYKKELKDYGFEVSHISMKERKVVFKKKEKV